MLLLFAARARFPQRKKLASLSFMRNRWLSLTLLIGFIVLGLASRKYAFLSPAVLGNYPGDALWAMVVYLCWSLVRPSGSVGKITALALATSYLVECSQLYQSSWVTAIRRTTIGHLVLGSTFVWLDLLAYTIGILFLACIDYLVLIPGKNR